MVPRQHLVGRGQRYCHLVGEGQRCCHLEGGGLRHGEACEAPWVVYQARPILDEESFY